MIANFFGFIRLEAEIVTQNFNAPDGDKSGDGSILPFLGFMLFILGLVVLLVGAVTFFSARYNFNLFFDQRDIKVTHMDTKDPDSETKLKIQKAEADKKKGKLLMIGAAVLFVISALLL